MKRSCSVFTTSTNNNFDCNNLVGSRKRGVNSVRFESNTNFQPKRRPQPIPKPQYESVPFICLRFFAFLFGFLCRPLYMLIIIAYANFSSDLDLFAIGFGLTFNMICIALAWHFGRKWGTVACMVFEVTLMYNITKLTCTMLTNLIQSLLHSVSSNKYPDFLKRYHIYDQIPLLATFIFFLVYQLQLFIVLCKSLKNVPLFPKRPKTKFYHYFRKIEKYTTFFGPIVMLLLTCIILAHLFSLETCGHGKKCDGNVIMTKTYYNSKPAEVNALRDRVTAMKMLTSYMTRGSYNINFDEVPLKSGLKFTEDKVRWDVLQGYNKNPKRNQTILFGPIY
ncbi:unnamed protein product [Bursaphelenchus okinawaensis]|uniref:Uncharacterized protein n=1 Tax=Bursaphelenchus okinawaensis TaxID=465554 RepID=A0A811LJ92_9BILA|nr:unnamed protein product [Bursaphelenchus okinawaensis]CAG9124678.1 unnamed protein product [Bursaphelenchus okinawaensis]